MTAIAYLGPPNDHWLNLSLTFQRRGVPLVQIADSLSWRDQSPALSTGWRDKGPRLQAQVFGTSDRQYLQYALDLIDRAGVTCVLAFWGTRPLPDIRALKRRRPHVRFILTVLCHPLGLNRQEVYLQHLVLRHAMPNLDGLIVSSDVMRRYIEKKIPGSRKKLTLVLPPCWAEEYVRHAPFKAAAVLPNVVFLGRMDWRAAQSTDNVSTPLRELMKTGVDVHYGESPDSEIRDEHAHPFEVLDMRQLVDFAAKFDASLILYDLTRAQVVDRFEVTIPDRLITSVAAGIPIAIPASGYAACREYLHSYGAVIEFVSMEQLAKQLRDRDKVEGLRELAWERSKNYRAENTLPELLAFIRQIEQT